MLGSQKQMSTVVLSYIYGDFVEITDKHFLFKV